MSLSSTLRQNTNEPAAPSRPQRRESRQSARLKFSGWLGIALVLILFGAAIVGPSLISTDPAKQSLSDRLLPPVGFGGDWSHPLGTDQLGRDLLARVVSAARLSLFIGITTTIVTGLIGTFLGMAAGYFGGRIDRFVVFLLDVALALPALVIAIAVTAAFIQLRWQSVLLVLAAGTVPLVLINQEVKNGVYADRSFFGIVRVTETCDGRYRKLLHGTTLHGAMAIRDRRGGIAAGQRVNQPAFLLARAGFEALRVLQRFPGGF